MASFDDVSSPRIVATINDYDVRVAHTLAEHIWHVHEDTDEFFLVLGGRFDVTLRDAEGHESTVCLVEGDTFVVPTGTEHKPSSPATATLRSARLSPASTTRPGCGRSRSSPSWPGPTPVQATRALVVARPRAGTVAVVLHGVVGGSGLHPQEVRR